MDEMISVFGSKVGAEEASRALECMRQQKLGFGPNIKLFEERFAERLSLKNFAMLDNGSNALFLAIHLLNLPKGSEIVLPSFTWVACAHAIVLNGHVPVFCDVEIETMNVTRATIEAAMTKQTKAIMVVHYAGKPVDLAPIMRLGLPIVEDAAHAVDSSYRGEPCGSIADIGIYSFDAVKNLATPMGGGITAKQANYIERAKKLRCCGVEATGSEAAASNPNGRWWEHEFCAPFMKMIPSNMAAAIGLGQLNNLDVLQARRKQIWEIYQREFSPIPWLHTPSEPDEFERHSYFTYAIRVPRRDELARHLLKRKIYTALRFQPLHLTNLYRSRTSLPNAESLGENCLNIPLQPNLTDENVSYIVDSIKSFANVV